ncbi:hypothetical protein D3C85_1124770 [compost metagenome]
MLRAQGDFQGAQAAGGQGVGQRQDVLLAFDGDHREDARGAAQLVDGGNLLDHAGYGYSAISHGLGDAGHWAVLRAQGTGSFRQWIGRARLGSAMRHNIGFYQQKGNFA